MKKRGLTENVWKQSKSTPDFIEEEGVFLIFWCRGLPRDQINRRKHDIMFHAQTVSGKSCTNTELISLFGKQRVIVTCSQQKINDLRLNLDVNRNNKSAHICGLRALNLFFNRDIPQTAERRRQGRNVTRRGRRREEEDEDEDEEKEEEEGDKDGEQKRRWSRWRWWSRRRSWRGGIVFH